MAEEKKEDQGSNTLVIVLSVLLAILVIGFAGWGAGLWTHPRLPPLEGKITAASIDVGSKIPGRIRQILVKEGDRVGLGDRIAIVTIPDAEVRARAETASPLRHERGSLKDETILGTSDMSDARTAYEAAIAAERAEEKNFARVSGLYRQGLVPEQRLEEERAALDSAREAERAAKEAFILGNQGATPAAASPAAGNKGKSTASKNDAVIRSPMNGEISHIFLGTGDAAPSGFPIATIADLSSPWAAFSAPASEAAGLKEGDVIHIRIPAIGGPAHEFRIETIRERRNAKGGDAEPIEEIRARPLKPIPGLQPGMSALFERRSS